MQQRLVARWLPLAAVSAGWITLGCAGKPAPAVEREDTLSSEALRISIDHQIGTAACTSPAVCRALPLGSKPCGGPRQYLVYSLAVTDSARLEADAARFSEAEAQRNREQGLMSDCSMLIAPQVTCVSGRCAAVESKRLRAY